MKSGRILPNGAKVAHWHKAEGRACATACPLPRALRKKFNMQILFNQTRVTSETLTVHSTNGSQPAPCLSGYNAV